MNQRKTVEFGINESASGMFAQYFNACYPNGCPQDQYAEVKQAFYSGIFSLLSLTLSDKFAEDEDVSVKQLNDIFIECKKTLNARFETEG